MKTLTKSSLALTVILLGLMCFPVFAVNQVITATGYPPGGYHDSIDNHGTSIPQTIIDDLIPEWNPITTYHYDVGNGIGTAIVPRSGMIFPTTDLSGNIIGLQSGSTSGDGVGLMATLQNGDTIEIDIFGDGYWGYGLTMIAGRGGNVLGYQITAVGGRDSQSYRINTISPVKYITWLFGEAWVPCTASDANGIKISTPIPTGTLSIDRSTQRQDGKVHLTWHIQ